MQNIDRTAIGAIVYVALPSFVNRVRPALVVEKDREQDCLFLHVYLNPETDAPFAFEEHATTLVLPGWFVYSAERTPGTWNLERPDFRPSV